MSIRFRSVHDPDKGSTRAPSVPGGEPALHRLPLLTHHRELGSRIWVQTRIRYLTVLVIIAGAWLASVGIGIEGLLVEWMWLLGLALAVYNTVVVLLVRPYRVPERAEESRRFLTGVLYTTMGLDYLALTAAVWLAGGSRSPFLAFFLLHLINCILLSRRAAVASTLLAFVLLATLVLGEIAGLIPTHTPAGMIADPRVLDPRYAVTVLLLYGMLFASTTFMLIGFSELLRRSERQLHQANEELGKLSRLRRDFLHIALHNIQAPVGAATMLLNNLRAGFGGSLTPDQDRWLERSLKRLDDVNDIMYDLRVLSSLESERYNQEVGEVNLRILLLGLHEEYADLARSRFQHLTLEMTQNLPPVRGIERLLREAVANFITNAIKYTPEKGRIIIRARHLPPVVRIEVQDNGIGIAPEDQGRLFQEFVRIQRPGTQLSSIPGDGLGLSIAKRVAIAHGGDCGVQSELDRGSTFFLQIPTAE